MVKSDKQQIMLKGIIVNLRSLFEIIRELLLLSVLIKFADINVHALGSESLISVLHILYRFYTLYSHLNQDKKFLSRGFYTY